MSNAAEDALKQYLLAVVRDDDVVGLRCLYEAASRNDRVRDVLRKVIDEIKVDPDLEDYERAPFAAFAFRSARPSP